MHIAFLLPEYPHEKLPKAAGIGTSTKNLLKALIDKGLKITVFTYFQDKQEVFQDGKITIHKIKLRKYPVLTWKLNEGIINKYINNIIKKEQIDVLEVVDWTGISANMNFPIPHVMRLHGSDTYFCHLDARKIKKANYSREYKAYTKADKIIGVSEFVAKKTNMLFRQQKDFTVVHNGIFTNDFKPLENNRVQPYHLLYFGTIIRKKGVLELAKTFSIAVEKNPQIKLTLLGSDAIDIFEGKSTITLFTNLLSEKAKKQVKFVSQVPYDKVKNFLAEAAVIVLPSFAEALPMTWIEAMASGKALITSNIGWAKEVMIHNKTGYTVNPKNHDEFAHYIIELLENKDKREQFGTYAREIAIEKFDILGAILQKNIKAYEAVLSNNK